MRPDLQEQGEEEGQQWDTHTKSTNLRTTIAHFSQKINSLY